MTYPFDPTVRQRVTDLLYELLPALYRVLDLPEGATTARKAAAPRGEEELYKFLRVLAAPLAEVRQSVDELHADLFIDRCADWVVPYLADMVGTKLIFPDPALNRRDVRGTVAWRRRKGTVATLEHMGSDLSGQRVVAQEGWKRILMAQDLNLLRKERTIAAIGAATRLDAGRPGSAILAEQTRGPLNATFHAVDPRRISASTGRYHPKHIVHYTHPTQLFPLRQGTAFDRTARDGSGDPLDGDLRYAFHPLGAEAALRVRRAEPADPLKTDRVAPMHFAARPGDYFDQTGTSNARFTVRLTGLAGGVAEPRFEARTPSALPASEALVEGEVAVTLLEHTSERLTSPVDVEVYAVPLAGAGHDTPDTQGAALRGGVRISAAGGAPLPGGAAPVASPFVTMLRLRAVAPETAAYFPGATVELSGAATGARLGATDVALAAAGFLRGALTARVPATWVYNSRWLLVAADGSVFDAQSPAAAQAGGDADLALAAGGGGALRLPGDALSTGPGAAWPPLPPTAAPERWRSMPASAGRGPAVIHGAPALRRTGPDTYGALGAGVTMGLVFAARAGESFHPFLRLELAQADPTAATAFSVLDAAGAVAGTAAAIRQRSGEIAQLVGQQGGAVELVVRLEASAPSAVLPPCEVVYTGATGEVVLVHLPALETGEAGFLAWQPTLAEVSDAVSVGADGSTTWMGTLDVARAAYGAVAPIREAVTLRRRRVRQRSLCPWKNETPLKKLAPTPAGALDVDPLHGLFALAKGEPAPPYTSSVEGLPVPAPVGVDYQEGYSHHVGARPDAREPIVGVEQLTPTRLVVGGGSFHRSAPINWHGIRRYGTLTEALAAIAADAAPGAREVIEIEDSATYAEPGLTWPANLASLTVQAAEFERPVLVLGADWKAAGAPPAYEALTLRGLVLAQGAFSVEFPPARDLRVELCTAEGAEALWSFAEPAGRSVSVQLLRVIAGRIAVAGKAKLSLEDSVVDAAGGKAIDAPDASVDLARVTVVARAEDLAADGVGTDVRVLEATEVIFDHRVVARDRFRGCFRYSRVEPGSRLPRKHRVVEDEVAFVTRDRRDPAHLRLAAMCARAIVRGAEDGSEMGAFHGTRLAQRTEALVRRLIDFTPAGLSTGLIRLD
ncbi:hypothetical protein [Sorangium cellulosum]|uniref:Uncharacterized protein n=1 Tax=Sorangium cellulosum So0157-2 TaxID=1254432 RepID=S4YB03_SORCE|nr:hypothetical protein [Sorangium cellulosum]AGP41496.1 hypothetical protein SCE1572_47640 [Sorangium cellulosum So0157-2]